MKNKDLLLVGGIGLLAYMLMSKPQPAEAKAGGITSIIPLPSAGQSPLDIGNLLGGMASLFSAIPQQVIPEINIPEFHYPDIIIPEFIQPDWDKFMPDWEKFIPVLPDELKIPDILPDLIPIPNIIPDVLPFIFDGNGNGDGAMVTAFKSGINIWDKSWYFIDSVLRGKLFAYGEDNALDILFPRLTPDDPNKIPESFVKESEALFEEAGFTEITPENYKAFVATRDKLYGVDSETAPTIDDPFYYLRGGGGL